MGAGRGLANTTIYYNAYSYDSVRDQLVGDGATHVDKTVLLSLPTLDQFTTDLYLPSGWSYNGNIDVPAADSKALGLPGFGGADASIAFNTDFSYYCGTGGLPPTEYDLQTAAMHEIGHALGFSSSVDWVDNLYDYTGLGTSIYPLDLYHFRTADLTLAQNDFANTPRSIEPGVAASISDGNSSYSVATGAFNGDGFQASHWKRTIYAGQEIGIMDPGLASGEVRSISAADIRALELIGYDLPGTESSPEPATITVVLGGLFVIVVRRRAAVGGYRRLF
jgi:hypothetical protein